MNLIFWSALLIIQNASFTWVSRARNSGSFGYHAIAAVFSNGIWFASQFILINAVVSKDMSVLKALLYATIYILSTVCGSVSMHYISIKYLEKDKRKVGA